MFMEDITCFDRLIDKKELKKLVPYSASHIARLEKLGEFPTRVQIGKCRVAWSYQAVQRWIAARKAEANQERGQSWQAKN